ncbi:OLC1v1007516C1 [Oldenlandia corymbosa var. corymbosa]|uniref:OLC1v1007516C1 n=1 Tax=Oldenlandia corymbosa var. corymbosa TaxID=529605 RepID=A0AAV1DJU2_OLDCO|nr:OLC1v1007516C1 [Oldenlandia corymbosa var. corymbosa]
MGCLTFSNSSTTMMAGFGFWRHPKNWNFRNLDHPKSVQIGDNMILKSNLIPTVDLSQKYHLKSSKLSMLLSASTQRDPEIDPVEDDEGSVEDLRVPSHWLDPAKASQESEWLRVTLHKWLDDEYCPEETNIKISEVAGRSFYKTLTEKKKTELGEILLDMVQELSTISYQESFHGAFSSANAAVNLIIQRIHQD